MRIWNGYQRGINFGGWLSQGEKSDRHYDNFITESDFATVAKWGLDHVRIPIDYDLLESEGGILKESGLVSIDERRGGYDKFWNRAMFPIMDVHNKVIGFGGRVMGDGEPKYLNSPETVSYTHLTLPTT